MQEGLQLNNPLGIAQYVTAHLSDIDATRYLLTIDAISFEDWRKAKELLPSTCSANRNTIEGNIKEIVSVFQNTEVTTKYFLDLSILPGLSINSLQLVSFTSSTLWAAKQNFVATVKQVQSVYDTDTNNLTFLNASPPTAVIAQGKSPKVKPSYAAKARDTSKPRKNRTNKVDNWTNGENNTPSLQNQPPQLKHICLAIKSGPKETEDTLKQEFKKNGTVLEDLKIEAYSQSHQSTMFRVQFTTPASLLSKWTEASTWPTRISVRHWRGNPRQQLTPINTRTYRKKIFIGNLSPDVEMNVIEENMRFIYETEMAGGGPIANVKAHLNETSWDRQQQLQREDMNHVMRKSACVILTSHPGKPLSNIGLNLELYPRNLRRSVRLWTGPVPQQEPQPITALNNLKW